MTLVTADGTGGIVPDDDYAKLSYYLWCVLKACGVEILKDVMVDSYRNDAHTHLSPEEKDALYILSSGKQCGLTTVSYQTVFLSSLNGSHATTTLPNSNEPTNLFLPIETAATTMDTTIDSFRMGPGGIMEVHPTHVMLCNEAWCRTFWVDPLRRIQAKQAPTLSGPPPASDQDIRALFVHNAATVGDPLESMAAALEQMMAAKTTTTTTTPAFESFSGTGNSLGTTTTTTTTASSAEGVFDPATLPDPLPLASTTTTTASTGSTTTTSIAVRLWNGKRKIVQLNLSATVADLAAQLKDQGSTPFRLMAGFPPKPLLQPNATLEEAGLKGAQVSLQKV